MKEGAVESSAEEFGLAIHEHRGLLRRICRAYADSLDEREDLEQEMVLQLWRAWPFFAGRSLVSTWMYRVAINTAISCLRKKKKHPPFQELCDIPAPGGDVNDADRLEGLYAALRRLDEGERTLLLLWLEDLSYKRIAEITGISEKTVSVRLTRARARLRRLVQGASDSSGRE